MILPADFQYDQLYDRGSGEVGGPRRDVAAPAQAVRAPGGGAVRVAEGGVENAAAKRPHVERPRHRRLRRGPLAPGVQHHHRVVTVQPDARDAREGALLPRDARKGLFWEFGICFMNNINSVLEG